MKKILFGLLSLMSATNFHLSHGGDIEPDNDIEDPHNIDEADRTFNYDHKIRAEERAALKRIANQHTQAQLEEQARRRAAEHNIESVYQACLRRDDSDALAFAKKEIADFLYARSYIRRLARGDEPSAFRRLHPDIYGDSDAEEAEEEHKDNNDEQKEN